MISTIIGCVIANLLTIAIIGGSLYYVYTKNQDKIEELRADIKEKISEVKELLEKLQLLNGTSA